MLSTTKLSFEEALQSDKNLLQFWLQGESYSGAWETFRIEIISHINKIKTEERTAQYNKILLHDSIEEIKKMLLELKTITEEKKQQENLNILIQAK